MSETISRRSLGRAALGLGLLPATGVAASARGLPTQDDPAKSLDKQLQKPLEGTARALAPAAVKAVEDAAAARRKHPLPEGSEPCTRYHAAPREVR